MPARIITVDKAQVAAELIEAGATVRQAARAIGVNQPTLATAIQRGRTGKSAPYLVALAGRVDAHHAKLADLCAQASERFGVL